MGIISAICNNQAYNYEDAFRAKDISSDAMKLAILDWYSLFYETEPNEHEDPCQRIPYTVVNKLTKTAFGEYSAQTDDPFLRSVLNSLDKHRIKATHAAMTGGRAFIKPYPTRTGISFSVITRPSILIFGTDDDGCPIDVGTCERTIYGGDYYTLLERRTIAPDGLLTITNQLYVAHNKDTIGVPTSLYALPKYKQMGILPKFTYQEPMRLGMAEIRCPVPNCVDGSDDPVAVYAAASGLIHNINRNEAQLNGEFERGKSRVIVSSDMLEWDAVAGTRRLRDTLFVGLDDKPEDLGITIFSPALRDASFLARKKEYLRNVESLIGLKRGLLSEVEAVERSATEVTSSEGDYALTIGDFQNMWEIAAREACTLAGIIGKIYNVSGAHDILPEDIAVDWGNGILYDEEKMWQDYKDMVAAGLLKPEIAIGWRFNMPTETSEDLAQIRAKYMPELSNLLGGGEV